MKHILSLVFLFSVTSALARNIVDCKSGSGYYGNVELDRNGDRLTLRAAQGFAYEMARTLLIDETAEFIVEFETRNCKKLQSNRIECMPPSAKISAIGLNGKKFAEFAGLLDLKILRSRGATNVELTLTKDHREASESYNFLRGPDLEGCSFKL